MSNQDHWPLTTPRRHGFATNPGGQEAASTGKAIEVAIGLIWRDGRLLIARRGEGEPLGGLWEFPGGKRRPSEPLEACLRREVREEMGIEVGILRPWDPVRYSYPEFSVVLFPFECEWEAGELRLAEGREFAWIEPKDLTNFPFPPANEPLLERLME